jgi:hypothetical protein
MEDHMANLFDALREHLLRAGVAPRHVRRYLRELGDHLADLREEEEGAGRTAADAEVAALERLGRMDALATAMMEQRQFQSWSARAPWAAMVLAPLLALAAARFVALVILWTGWQMFLPGAATPFVRIDGLAILYFGVGRMIYFGAPFAIGWSVGMVAARQRLKSMWPAAGLVLSALLAGTSRVYATGPSGPGEAGHVGLGFALGPAVHGISDGVIHALVILTLTVLPYLVWRWRMARAATA